MKLRLGICSIKLIPRVCREHGKIEWALSWPSDPPHPLIECQEQIHRRSLQMYPMCCVLQAFRGQTRPGLVLFISCCWFSLGVVLTTLGCQLPQLLRSKGEQRGKLNSSTNKQETEGQIPAETPHP